MKNQAIYDIIKATKLLKKQFNITAKKNARKQAISKKFVAFLRVIIMKKKSKLIIAIIIAVLIFTVGILLAIAENQSLTLLRNNIKDSIPQDVFIKKENRCIQLILNFLMLAIGGSLLSFSTIFNGIYFRNRLYDKLSAIIGLAAVFTINLFVEFGGIWSIFTGLTIIITFDCLFIFIKETYDCLAAKKAKKDKQI